jgi:maleamate amidohydrolase
MRPDVIDWNIEVARVRELRASRSRIGPGERPAVIVIDFQRAFTEHEHIGPGTAIALAHTRELLESARAAGVPVIYAVMVLDSLDDRMLAQRVRSSLTERCERGDPWTEISDTVAAVEGDHIVEKTVASAFFRTRLEELLDQLGIDELIVAGTSTSGCIRATVIDGAYRDYRISVVEECCDDFRALSGEVSLWDMQDRFGDVVSKDWVLDRFSRMLSAAAQEGPVRA